MYRLSYPDLLDYVHMNMYGVIVQLFVLRGIVKSKVSSNVEQNSMPFLKP